MLAAKSVPVSTAHLLCVHVQVFAMPYVQAHMRRFNADERRRLLQKQSSLACSRKLKTLESKVATLAVQQVQAVSSTSSILWSTLRTCMR